MKVSKERAGELLHEWAEQKRPAILVIVGEFNTTYIEGTLVQARGIKGLGLISHLSGKVSTLFSPYSFDSCEWEHKEGGDGLYLYKPKGKTRLMIGSSTGTTPISLENLSKWGVN